MISPNLVDDSAIKMAENLTPGGLDRHLHLPVAALAICCADGCVALFNDGKRHGLRLPLSHELPVIQEGSHEHVAKEVARHIGDIATYLNVAERHITGISGLNPRDGTQAARCLRGGPSASLGRDLAILPFSVTLKRRPQIPGFSWHTPSNAANHLRGKHADLPAATALLILRRLQASRSLEKV
ncbi:MAG TPA: hypothetical protein VIS56_02660 [Candidatus Saccharimonadales bacterium]